MPSAVLLWSWPASDELAWQELTGDVMTHAAYQTLLAAIQADLERQGLTVRRVPLTVAEMKQRLAKHGLPNEPGGRAAALALE